MNWIRKIAGPLIVALITVALGGLLAVTLARYAPGFDVDERQLDSRLTHESLEAIHHESDQQRNIASYYVAQWVHFLHGDLGYSRSLQRPVRQILAERGAATLRLVSVSLLLSWTLAVALFVITWCSGSPLCQLVCEIGSGALLCLPSGAIALVLLMLDGPAAVALALVVFPKVFRYLSSLANAAAKMPHIVTAQAKGVTRSALLIWHVIPVIRREIFALIGVSVGLVIGGTIPIEALCGIPGLGQLAWQSALARDLPVLASVSFLIIAATVLANSGADLLAERRSLPA